MTMVLLAETVTRTVFAGRFSPTALVYAGAVLAAVILLVAWWETKHAKRWPALAPAALRLTAAGVVLWMLAEPSIETSTRYTRRKSVAVFVDSSASMGLVDPPEQTADAARWAACGADPKNWGALAALDAAVGALSAAEAYCDALATTCRTGGQGETIRRQAAHLADSFGATADHLQHAAGLMDAYSPEDRSEVEAIYQTLVRNVGPGVETFGAGAGAGDGGVVLTPDRRARLEQIGATLSGLTGRLSGVADRVAEAAATGDPDMRRRMYRQESMSRSEKVARLLEVAEKNWLAEIEQKAIVRRFQFHRSVWGASPRQWSVRSTAEVLDPTQGTSLTAALEQAARESAGGVEAVIIITDGAHNQGRDPIGAAAALTDTPVFVIPIGTTSQVRDVILHHVQGPRTVLKSDEIVIEATVDAHGCLGEPLTVELLQDDVVIDRREVPIVSDTFVCRVSFVRKAGPPGEQNFELRVPLIPGEHTDANNAGSFHTVVLEDTLRVLVIDEYPRWEYRYLRNLFDRDEQIEMDRLLIEPIDSRGRPAEGVGFPADLDDWSRYRVVVLGDVSPGHLTPLRQQQLEQYVGRRGGSLILIAGRNAMPAAYRGAPIEKLLPVTGTAFGATARRGFEASVSPEGRALAALSLTGDMLSDDRLWRGLFAGEPMHGMSPYSTPKPISHVLLNATPYGADRSGGQSRRAMLSWQSYGAGRVVYLAAPVTHRLRFRQGDRYHHVFWGQLLRWAMTRDRGSGSRTVRLTTDKIRYSDGEPVQVTMWLNQIDGSPVTGASPQVRAAYGERAPASLALTEIDEMPGVYWGELARLPVGPVTIAATGSQVEAMLAAESWLTPIETVVAIDPPDQLELRNSRCDLPLLTKIAEAAGGSVAPPTALGAVLGRLDMEPQYSETFSRRPVWNTWGALAIIAGCLILEWVIRKRLGMA